MMDKVLLAGFGGQGVMFIGKVLAYSGMLGGREVCWIPSYGPEMRGGTANCSVLVSDEEINSPVISQADAGIVLNQPSYDRFLGRIKPGGTLVVNSSIVALTQKRDDINIIAIEATELANEIGNSSLANMVCLGALLPSLSLVNMDSVTKAMDEVVGKKKPELYDLNVAAINKGMNR
ncbi:2-oxoacid:acceptor oxidoreductase family protein [Sporomusa sp.]|uniref:2-oxoacid:acceptor oxidoreductase family protein n=1 Tax=Sporomusa sp. TaxID=2078658 RepID=UPI002BC403E8|nr:2-oxoacid:acceptor oxidoreductase family protein [Sporomusa sp.]HWR45933.1 2-oxoacid:acceptor oxidoreductase family protein [Sporomusa sp.]